MPHLTLRHGESKELSPDEVRHALRQEGWATETIELFVERLDRSDVQEMMRRLMRLPSNDRSEAKRKPLPSKTKAAVWEMTKGRCWYCNEETNPFDDFTVDHVLPLARGGTDDAGNLVPACRRCNCSKGARLLGDE